MKRLQVFAAAFQCVLIASPLIWAGDLSRYREFGLDSTLVEVARQAGKNPEEAKVVHERPVLIQALSLRPGSDDAVKEIQFSFYDGELFRMMVHYDRFTTEGLTSQDVIDATSVIYGEAVRPADEITLPQLYGTEETVAVIARWEDADWSFNLVQFKYEPSFALAVLSKRLGDLARTAIDDAIRLDKEEAPQREIDQKVSKDLSKAAEQEEARIANRPRFRP